MNIIQKIKKSDFAFGAAAASIIGGGVLIALHAAFFGIVSICIGVAVLVIGFAVTEKP